MQSFSLFAPAKINLHLEIIGDRPDGYHELVMIMQSIDLGDTIDIRANGTDEIRLSCQHPQVPLDETNLAYKAAMLMRQQYPQLAENFGGLDISINKKIPLSAGLAGGSTDGAAVLVGINLLWSLGLTKPELCELAEMLGSDVPFCINGGTAIATGRGEKVEPLPDLSDIWLILAKYDHLSVSTPWAYQSYREKFSHLYVSDTEDINQRTHQVHSGNLAKAITHKDLEQIGALLYNDLEKVVLPEYPQVEGLIEQFRAKKCLGSIMSGSGSTVFALCRSQAEASRISQEISQKINDPRLNFWITKMCSHGIFTM